MSTWAGLLVVWLAASPASVSASAYRSPSGKFSVNFPCGKPAVTQRAVGSDLGDLTVHTFSSTNPGDTRSFQVSYVDYPLDRVRRRQGELIKSALEGLVGDESRVKGEADLRIPGVVGRELRFERGRYLVMARVMLVGNRLYQLVALGPASGGVDAQARTFFDSFQAEGTSGR